jgi:hypothetical protein
MSKMYFLPFRPAFDSAGITVPGSQHYFTLAGTNTPSAPYTDAALTSPHANPVIANGIGYLDPVYLDPAISYRVRIYDADAEVGVAVPLEEYDPYVPALVSADIASDLADDDGSSLLGFLQAGTGAVARTVQDKLRESASGKDFGAAGDNSADDGAELASAIAAATRLQLSPGTYKNTSTALTLPFAQMVKFEGGADIASSGSGSVTYNGVTIREVYNPGNLTGWTGTSVYNFEGFAVDVGGYGPRQFGSAIAPSANVGAINIPASANCGPHSAGLAGYAKTASTTTGAVGVFGEGNAAAAGVLAWGGNFRVQDNGFAVGQIWSVEADTNVTHAGTVAVGVDSVGGSTAIPDGASSAFRAGPVGTFQNPAIPWGRGFFADDGANLIAMEVGALKRVGDTGATSQPSQPLHFYYLNGGGVRTLGLVAQVTSAALASLIGDVRIGGSFGYATGYGGAVTQATSKSTGVTLNKICGAITMNNASLAANTIVGFILTNSMIAADDIVHVWVKSGNASVGSYRANSEGNTSGARTIILENKTAGSLSEAIVLGFTVIKSVIA